jgi:hypothetical protein
MTSKTFSQVRNATHKKSDLSKEQEWLRQHSQEYISEWVVLSEGQLVGHTADNHEVAAIAIKARAQGIHFPYIKFISDQSEPVWMGWL